MASASGGLQEASIAARFAPSNPSGSVQAGKVIAPPGEIKLYARVSIRASNQTIDFSGSIFECWMNDSCLFIGDVTNSNSISNVTLMNPRGRPMMANGTKAMIDAITNRQIVDEVKFKEGLSKVIDGTVECLNASVWAKAGQP